MSGVLLRPTHGAKMYSVNRSWRFKYARYRNYDPIMSAQGRLEKNKCRQMRLGMLVNPSDALDAVADVLCLWRGGLAEDV